MPTSAPGPTVLVKKADGSTVRVALSTIKQAVPSNQKPVETNKELKDSVVQPQTAVPELTNKMNTQGTQRQVPSVREKMTDDLDSKDLMIKKSESLKDKVSVSNVLPGSTTSIESTQNPKPAQFQTDLKTTEKRNSPLLIKTKRAQPKKMWKPEDHASLLDEALSHDELLDKELSRGAGSEPALNEIFQEFPVALSPEAQARAHSLVLSFLKGVRDRVQFHEYAVAPFVSGGLGLTKEQAAQLTLLMEEKKRALHYLRKEELKMLKPKASQTQGMSVASTESGFNKTLAGEALAVRNASEALSTTTPVKDIFKDIAIARKSKIQKSELKAPEEPQAPPPSLTHNLASVLSKQRRAGQEHRPGATGQPRAVSVPRSSVQDMTPPAEALSKPMGPVEEMSSFSLTDFRRLAEDAEAAKQRLMAKFEAWKEESFLLYLETRRAWFQNPLFKQYQGLLIKAIHESSGLSHILSKEDPGQSPSAEECFALLEVHKALRV